MSFVHGRNTAVLLDALDVTDWFRGHELDVDVDTAETTTYGHDWKRHIPGQVGATVELEGLYDPDLAAMPKIDAGSLLTSGPTGLAVVGAPARLVKVISTAYAESSPVGDVVAFSWSVLADDPIGFGIVLHPLAEETDDGEGATHTGPVGGTTDGALIHYHVGAVSATDELDLLIEDSANGADWVTLAGSVSQTFDAPGAQRIRVAGAVRRYLRATWAITGSGDREVTFAVALARL